MEGNSPTSRGSVASLASTKAGKRKPYTLSYDSDDGESDTGDDSSDESSCPTQQFKLIPADDDGAFRWYYLMMFMRMQQALCRPVVKAWIKTIQDKKQSKYPYNGGKLAKERDLTKGDDPGELTKPPWWPAREESRHKEPDHIGKGGSTLECSRYGNSLTKDS